MLSFPNLTNLRRQEEDKKNGLDKILSYGYDRSKIIVVVESKVFGAMRRATRSALMGHSSVFSLSTCQEPIL